MRTFQSHLNDKIKDPEFRERFDEERRLLEISVRITEARKKKGLSQQELARKARVTQQQLSRIENGINCNMTTFLKVCHALGIKTLCLEEETCVAT